MDKIQLTKNSIENAILTDGKLVGGYVDGNGYISAKGNGTIVFGDSSNGGIINSSGNGSFAHGYVNTGTISAKGYAAVAMGYALNGTIDALGNGAHAEGYNTKALANGAHAEGYLSIASGNYSHAEGQNTIASGTASHAEGKGTTTALGTASVITETEYLLSTLSIKISDITYTLQEGDTVNYGSNYAKVSVINNRDYIITTDKALGMKKNDTINLVIGGSYGDCAHNEGYLTIATGDYSHAEGYQSIASGTASHAEGYQTYASGTYSHAEGYSTTASGTYSHAEGYQAIASGDYSHAEGSYVNAKGVHSHAEGHWTHALGEQSHAEGSYANAIGDYSHAEGKGSTGYLDTVSTASGNQFTLETITTMIDQQSFTLQVGDIVNCDSSYAKVTRINTYNGSSDITTDKSLGVKETNKYIYLVKGVSYGTCAHSEGYLTSAIENYAHAEGGYTKASGDYSHAEGCNTKALANSAHAEGYSTTASGTASHAEGCETKAECNYSHAEGYQTHALGEQSHAEGYQTLAFGVQSHAEGQGGFGFLKISSVNGAKKTIVLSSISTTISGSECKLQVGDIVCKAGSYYAKVTTIDGTTITVDNDIRPRKNDDISWFKGISYGANTHSEGYLTAATGDYAHAEGYQTIASGDYSHAEGYKTIASGTASHAGGYIYGGSIEASGIGSFAHGYSYGNNGDIIASKNGSAAFGIGTKAFNEGMMAIGKYNSDIEDPSILFVVGNGQFTTGVSRSNAFWVKDNGTAYSQNGFYDESDIRKKDVLSNISLEKSYELLDKCQEIIYVLKDDPVKKEQVGMIAQEVEEFFPEIVSTDNNGFKSLDYARLSVICLRLIKDIVEQIKEIKNEIKNLKN